MGNQVNKNNQSLGFLLATISMAFLFSISVAYAGPGENIRLGRNAMNHNHPNLALTHFRKSIKEIDENPEKYVSEKLSALAGLGYAALWVGNSHEAEYTYTKGLSLAKGLEDQKTMRVGLARALINLGRPREAYDVLKPVHAMSSDTELQSAIASALLGWTSVADKHLLAAAPHGEYLGPRWQARLYQQTSNFIYFPLNNEVNVGYHYSSDSDHNINQIYNAGITIPGSGLGDNILSPTQWYAGVRQTQINDRIGQIGISSVRGGWSVPLNRDWQYAILGAISTSRNWTFGELKGQINYQPSDSWGLNLSVDRAPIRTVTAVKNKILVNTISMGGFGRLRNIGTFSVSYFHQAFSDGNNRNGVIARITPEFYSFSSIPVSLGVQGYFRDYTSGYVPFDGYFNPHNYMEALGYIIYVQKFSPYSVVRLYAGFGSQTVDGITTPVKDFYGTITEIVSRNLEVSLTGGYTQVASSYGGGPGYHRSYVGANFTIPF